MRRGFVYFIQQEVTHAVKIGYTETLRKMHTRMIHLQIGSPYRLRLVFHMPGSRELERQFHTRFHAYRLSGEWFAPSLEMAEALIAIQRGQELGKDFNYGKTFAVSA